jgi:hypothetical protein
MNAGAALQKRFTSLWAIPAGRLDKAPRRAG